MKKRLWPILFALAGVILLSIPVLSLRDQYEDQYQANLKLTASQELKRIREVIQSDLKTSMNYAHFLELILMENPDLEEDVLTTYADMITTENKFVRSVILARDGIVSFIYPLNETHEDYLGLNLFEIPNRKEVVTYAKENRVSVTQGPFEEMGTQVIYNRQPVFIGDDFYGFISIGVDLNKIMEENDIAAQKGNIAIGMEAFSKYNNESKYIMGDKKAFHDDALIERLEFPGETMVIGAYPRGGWTNGGTETFQLMVPYYLGLFVSFLTIYGFTFLYWDRREMAYYDGLTQTMNKMHFERFLTAQLKYGQGKNAILLIDINDFKLINDTHGHYIGDLVLATISARIHSVIGQYDKLGRIGGDEFMVFLKNVQSPEDLKEMCQKIYDTTDVPIRHKNIEVTISLAIGFTLAEKGKSFEKLYKEADQHMYEIKNRVKKP